MEYSSKYLTPASNELRRQITYYDKKRPGLGEDFHIEVEKALDSIVAMPESWKKYPGWEKLPVVRMRSVNRFPFDIIYFLDGDLVVIVAVANEARRPLYWASRITTRMVKRASV